MMSEKVENLLVPNKQHMVQHLNFLFSEPREFKDGKIEIAFTDLNGKPNQAEYFDISDIEEAAEFAARKNATAGVNVYVGAALRNPDVPLVGRSDITDYYASTVAWVDIDDEGQVDRAKNLYKKMPPSMVVVTGRAPYLRAQFWWTLMHPETAPDDLKHTLGTLCSHFKGDTAVVDPARIMRLGGSIAWPYKKGREFPELTEIFVPENATKLILLSRLEKEFPASVERPVKATGAAVTSGGLRNPFTGNLQIEKLLEATRTEGQWHVNMRDAVAAMIGQRWPDAAIHIAVGPYLRDNSLKQDMITPLIHSGRVKFDKPNPVVEVVDNETGEVTYVEQKPAPKPPTALAATCIDDIDLDNIPPREFLYGTIIGRKYVTMIVAPPGAGKSMFTMQLAISAASGKEWGKWHPAKKNLNVWVYNNEEGQDELFRRIRAVMIENELQKSDFGGRFYIDSGETKPISVANVKDNVVVHTPDYEGLLAEVKNRKIDILIVDPFAETHSVTENSNEQIKDVVRLYRDIAFKANCAVLLVHHTRKGASEMAGEADSARGGGAQIGVVRRMFTLSTMTKNEADKIGVPPEKRKWFVRFDDAKTNITAPADVATWLKFKSVSIKNGSGLYPDGDSVGVLTHLETDKISAEFADEIEDRSAEILTLVVEFMDSKDENVSLVPDIIDYIKSFSTLRFSDRRLRDMVRDAAEKAPKRNPFILEGVAHSFSIITGTGPKKNAISVRKNSEIV